MSLRAIAKFGALLLGVLAIALTLRVAWTHFNVTQEIASSSAARWWRCQGVERPTLAEKGVPWTLTYSWSGLMGPGDVSLVLDSGGRATLTSSRHEQPSPLVAEYNVPEEEISRIALAVDRTGLLCETTHYRDGYIVWDLGRFSITITSGNYSRTVFVDECNTLDDPAALFEIRAALIALKPSLHESIGWASEGTASVPAQICAPWNQRAQ
jgi:hypothetical protein